MPEFHRQENVAAAKQHKCEWCFEPILKGEVHSYNVGKVDGDFYAYRLHDECIEPVADQCCYDGVFMPGDGAEQRGRAIE